MPQVQARTDAAGQDSELAAMAVKAGLALLQLLAWLSSCLASLTCTQ